MNEELKKEAREEFQNKFIDWNSPKHTTTHHKDKYTVDAIQGWVDTIIDKATLAERKRCAEVAREKGRGTWKANGRPSHEIIAEDIAQAIEKGEGV